MNRRITIGKACAVAALLWGTGQDYGQYVPTSQQLVPGVDYSKPNYANSPILTKFKDSLPGLASAGANNLGQYIPLAVPDTTTFPGTDYYELALVEYQEQLHSELPPTTLRGYVQVETAVVKGAHSPLPGGTLFGVDKPHYLGPIIQASRGKATRIKFYNLLPTMMPDSDLFIPTDITVMGAGMGPDGTMYPQNRATLHLHGGDNPWISDGTAHQWITPAGQAGTLIKGVSQQNVPDMWFDANGNLVPATTAGASNNPGPGAATFFWPNAQSGRLMFFHDHAYGMTRLDVYAGEAAGYLLTDPNERALNSYAPGGEIPLIFQDKTFVNDGTQALPAGYTGPATYNADFNTFVVDPTWALNTRWGQTSGSLWFPHTYMPNQNPYDLTGANSMGRWDYGPWFWPVFPVTAPLPQIPPDPATMSPGSPLPSIVPEAFMDTPLVNGTAYPFLNVQPTVYRFRILNACNDRYLNLQMYVASPIVSSINLTSGGSGYTQAPMVVITPAAGDTTGKGATATAVIDTTAGSPTFGQVIGIDVATTGSGYTQPPIVVIAPPGTVGGTTATATANLYAAPTEVGMVPASKTAGIVFPTLWTQNDTPGMTPNILDGRIGGVPDPNTSGPSFVHAGSEGGITPSTVTLPNTPIGYEQNKRSITVLNVYDHTLWMGPAERADVFVDFSQFAGKTLIVYNDAPAPLPAGDPRNDYYTCDQNNTSQGGAPSTVAGFGPNTRTIMQIRVAPAPAQPSGIQSITVTAPGTGYTPGNVSVTISDSGTGTGAGATATAAVSTGSVNAITLVNDGYGYTSPQIKIDPAAGDTTGSGAAATATIDQFGGIATVTITSPGSGYTLPPVVTISDIAGGTGAGATATASILAAGQITGITVTNPGTSPYTAPVVTITDNLNVGSSATAVANLIPTTLPAFNPAPLSAAVAAAYTATQPAQIVPTGQYARISDTSMTINGQVVPMLPKTIQELFDPLGRMNATLGVEVPFTTATIQTTIPYGFIDPMTELMLDNTIQIWKITHNGVDTHTIHFHLFNVQVVNRVGWDGAIKPPWPEELGLKESVKMNPLEDIVVALKAKVPAVPFALPINMRLLDPTMPKGSTAGFIGVDPNNNPVTVTNQLANFGAEYTWHCHLLGHEENDMMRPMGVAVPPVPPANLTFTIKGSSAVLKWVDQSPDESGFVVQRWIGTAPKTTIATLPAGTMTYTDTGYKKGAQYQVLAVNTVGSGVPGYPSLTAYSLPSNVAAAPMGAVVITSVAQAVAVGSPVVVKWSYSATDQTGFTVQRSTSNTFPANSTATFNVAGNVFTFSDTAVVVGLKKSTTYYYRVTPTNANGSGSPSSVVSLLVHP